MPPERTGSKQTRASGRWVRGQSGNPRGRPLGSRNRTTLAVQSLIDDEAQKIARKAVKMALQGDTTALRVVLERLLPPIKHRAVHLTMPAISSVEDIPVATAHVIAAVALGEIAPSDGEAIVRMMDTYRRAAETADIEERLSALEMVHVKGD